MSKESAVQLPGKAYDAEGVDLGGPTQQLLIDLHVLEKDGDVGEVGPLKGTPFSIQVITAGATSLGKVWTIIVGLLGGAGAITAGIKGLGYSNDDPVKAASFTLSAAVVLAAAVISVAIMVRADVSARAVASAAQFEARAAITSALLRSASYNLPAPRTPEPNYMMKTNGGRWYPVKGFRLTDHGVVADLVGEGVPVPLDDADGLIPTSSWNDHSA